MVRLRLSLISGEAGVGRNVSVSGGDAFPARNSGVRCCVGGERL